MDHRNYCYVDKKKNSLERYTDTSKETTEHYLPFAVNTQLI